VRDGNELGGVTGGGATFSRVRTQPFLCEQAAGGGVVVAVVTANDDDVAGCARRGTAGGR